MNGHAAETYMATMVLRDALERAGTTDREAVRDALAETEICGDDNILPYECIRFERERTESARTAGNAADPRWRA